MSRFCKYLTCLTALGVFTVLSCHESHRAHPRPHMYPYIEFPEREKKPMALDQCPFDAQIPVYTHLVQKETFFKEESEHPCWFDLNFEIFDATLHCSYYQITSKRDVNSLVEDAYTMASKHNVMANYRREYEIHNPYNGHGIIFEISGPVASTYQFFISDSTRHFLRGSLYFNSKVKQDSVAPILTFIKKDVDKFLSSIKFFN